ncbi:FG-GAP repeat protein [Methylococcus geothermalis]|uniref:Integrin alpha beta-propellor repeat protein n=1 Tax=Methylococcus geothermalis TaxID=2681310 RepID=A0A858Q7V3_9GAMM|nr:FG-GAP repeat protein [Methylococcus geothermalis]QJD29875.1 hypothetical protein GNH96_07730 [Methylococcus geothermalis]
MGHFCLWVRIIGWVLVLAAPGFGAWAAGAETALPPELAAAVSADLRKIEAAEGGHVSLHPEQGLALRFDGEGVAVGPARPAPGWRWGLRLTGYGTPDALRPVAPAEVSARASRIEYRRGVVTEWYENRAEGLEQGFTLAAPPVAGAQTLVLGLALEGGLTPSLDPEGRAVAFRDGAGAPVLRYQDLHVVDAAGKTLPAHLALAGGGLRIEVDARGAAWPVVVDPLVTSEAILTASDKWFDAGFGYSVALSGDTALVGSPYRDPGGVANAGQAYVYVRSGGTWTQQAILSASDKSDYAGFGVSVALSGDTALVGAYLADPGGLYNAGQAYVYVRSGGSWTEQAILSASDPSANAYFGSSVAVSGNRALVGAPSADSGSVLNAGQAYVYVRWGGSWSEQAILTASDKSDFADFGSSVAVSGNTALVGARYADPGGLTNAGQAYVYVRSGGSWTQQAILAASDKSAGAYFGASVALAGNRALVGAPEADSGGFTYAGYAGQAYVYARSGGTWSEQAILSASDKSASAGFGSSVALAGNRALVGAPYADPGGLTNAGQAYAYTLFPRLFPILFPIP